MNSVVIRPVHKRLEKLLRERAARNKRSLDDELRTLVTAAAHVETSTSGFVARFRSSIRGAETELEIPSRWGGRPRPRFD